MRSVLSLPIAFAIGISTIPGAVMATSTTCSTSVVCAEYVNTSSGVAIHGEANTGIGVRGTSVGNTVFVTPEGESNELYVAQKTPGGFVVREAHGGHATIAIEYRIVAKPRYDDGQRLTAMHLTPPVSPTRLHASTHLLAAMSPEDRLRRSIGPAAYVKALTEVRARLAGK